MGLGKNWGTDSGLLDDFDMEVMEVWFGPQAEADDQSRIYLFFRGPAYVEGQLVDEEYIARFSCGKNWEAIDGGGAVENAGGGLKFNSRSGCGVLVEGIIEIADEDEDLLEALGDGDPTSAETWTGLNLHFVRDEHKFTPKDGEEQTFSQLRPTAFNGVIEAPAKAKKGAAKKASAKAPAKAKGKDKDVPTPAALKRAIKKKASEFEADEFDEFADAVFDEDEFPYAGIISEDADLKEWILDQEDGVWAEVHGDED